MQFLPSQSITANHLMQLGRMEMKCWLLPWKRQVCCLTADVCQSVEEQPRTMLDLMVSTDICQSVGKSCPEPCMACSISFRARLRNTRKSSIHNRIWQEASHQSAERMHSYLNHAHHDGIAPLCNVQIPWILDHVCHEGLSRMRDVGRILDAGSCMACKFCPSADREKLFRSAVSIS